MDLTEDTRTGLHYYEAGTGESVVTTITAGPGMRPPATHRVTSATQTRSSIAWLVADAAGSVDFVAAASLS